MVLSTISRSRATGARTSNVTRRLEFQYCRSPRKSLLTSLNPRSSIGRSGLEMMATSAAARSTVETPARRVARQDPASSFTKLPIVRSSEGEARLHHDGVEVNALHGPAEMPVLE